MCDILFGTFSARAAEHKDWTSFVAGIGAATSASLSASFYTPLQGPALPSMSPEVQSLETLVTDLKPRSSAWVFHSASTGEPSHLCSASFPLLLRAAALLMGRPVGCRALWGGELGRCIELNR